MNRKMLVVAWTMFHAIRKSHNMTNALRNCLLILAENECYIATDLIEYEKLMTSAVSIHRIMEHGNTTIRFIMK